MPKSIPTEKQKKIALEKSKKEFPGNPALQEIHYIRALLEIEWKEMTIEEIQEEVKKAKKELSLYNR